MRALRYCIIVYLGIKAFVLLPPLAAGVLLLFVLAAIAPSD
jgi:hypothetical protein